MKSSLKYSGYRELKEFENLCREVLAGVRHQSTDSALPRSVSRPRLQGCPVAATAHSISGAGSCSHPEDPHWLPAGNLDSAHRVLSPLPQILVALVVIIVFPLFK